MEALLTYIIQVNLLLALIYLGYQVLLKDLTFYRLNRVYFIFGSIYAFVYPFLDVKAWFAKSITIPQGIIMEYFPLLEDSKEEGGFYLSDLLVYLLAIGGLILLTRLLIQLGSLLRIHWHSKPSQWRDYIFRNVIFPITPFSFFNKIYLHKEQHQDLELYDIFKHEQVHVRGHHSIDVLLFEIVLLCCWFNPFVWYMRKAVRQNLEFLTDQQVLDKGVDRQTYQYSLLNVTKQGASVGISNQFNFKTLKKRIMMMNKKRSSQLQLGKYVFLLPVLIIAGITFTVNQAEAKIERVVVTLNETDLNQQIKKVMIQHPRKDTTYLDSIKDINTRAFADYIQGKPRSGGTIRFVDITPSKRPLVILDGEKLPINFNIDAINPKSIKSLKVLIGADAKSYGEEAKNGVIVIETKKEDDGKGPQGPKELSGEFIGMKANNNIDTDSVPVKVITKVQLQGIPKDTKIIIDEKESNHDEYKKLNPNELENVHIIKDSNGGKPTIKFTTKEFARKNNLQSTTFSGKPVSEPRITVKGQPASGPARITVKGEPGSEPARMTVKGEPDSEITQVIISNPGHTQNSKPGAAMVRGTLSKDGLKDKLVVIDGKIANKKAIDKLDNNQIEYLNQLDPQGGKALYGKKGEKGVVIIGTKSNNSK
ncbi:M56 family metallopeptidase [Sphingobacterium sp.]|uniref:M56 family metallopeptidase n=1 Tax=Sphingobacterium sp. TaxID=341027 RepID=UPI0028AD9358|nr:M56 family metallopeptidase [Sphingobacterium sp.]